MWIPTFPSITIKGERQQPHGPDTAAQPGGEPPGVCLQEPWPWLVFMLGNESLLLCQNVTPRFNYKGSWRPGVLR